MEHRDKRLAAESSRAFGLRVRDERQQRGWTQGDLATRLASAGYGMHQTTIAKLENGTRPTTVEELFALATVFEMPAAELIRPIDERTAAFRQLLAARRAWDDADRRLRKLEAERAAVLKAQDHAKQLMGEADRRMKESQDGQH